MFDKGTFLTKWKYDEILGKNNLILSYQIGIPVEIDPEGKLPTKQELLEKMRDAIMEDIDVKDSKKKHVAYEPSPSNRFLDSLVKGD